MAKRIDRKTVRTKKEVFKITLWLPDQHALNEVLAAGKVMLAGGAPRRESDGTYRIELYASPAEGKKIIALGYRNEVDKTYGEMLAMRQKEVSKIDRFKGGTVKPTGIGEKR
jgi:hypothetical protein